MDCVHLLGAANRPNGDTFSGRLRPKESGSARPWYLPVHNLPVGHTYRWVAARTTRTRHCKTEGEDHAAWAGSRGAGKSPGRRLHLARDQGLFVAIGSIIAAIICAVVAGAKGRNPIGWGILGLFFSILTLIVIAIIPSKKS